MLMSMVVAFTITPWLAYHVLKRGRHGAPSGVAGETHAATPGAADTEWGIERGESFVCKITPDNPHIYVNRDNTGAEDGLTWATGFGTIQEGVDAAALTGMRAPEWQPLSTVFLAPDRPLPNDLGTAGPLTANVTVRHYDAQRILYDVESAGAGWLVIADAWYPGWSASVDGKAVPLYRADILFRAVRVPAGAHRVRLSFDSPAWESGMTASIVAAIFLAALLAWGWRSGMKMV